MSAGNLSSAWFPVISAAPTGLREVARLTGGQPVITTASDVQGKPALDVMAQQAGLEIENIDRVARLARALLEGSRSGSMIPMGA